MNILKNGKVRITCGLIVLGLILLLPSPTHAMEPIQQVLTQEFGVGHQVKVVWNALLGFANTIMVIALLVIAFANILHIQIDKYAVKKILPSLITAIILANFSYFICRFFIDIANMLLSFVLTSSGGSDQSISSKLLFADAAIPKPDTGASGTFYPLAWAAFFSYLGTIVGSVFMAILAYLFFIRNWILYFLVALSPLGFIGLALPQTQTLFQTWWKQFLQWLFMPVVASFWLWVGAQFLTALKGSVGGTMMFVFAVACFYMAFTTPFKMGGAIMKGWGGLGKKVWGATGGALGKGAGNLVKNRYINPLVDEYKNRVGNWYTRQGKGSTLNPIGAWQRRGQRITDRRVGWKKALEGSQNTSHREAWGGKYGQYEPLSDKIKKAINPNHKSQALRYGHFVANADSDFGEQEWIEEKVRNDAYEDNYQHRAATVAWELRTTAEKKRKERIDNQVVQDAFNPERTDDNKFYGAEAGSEGDQRAKIQERYLAETTRAEHTGLIAKKMRNDFELNNTGFSMGIAQLVDQFQKLGKTIADTDKDLEAIDKDPQIEDKAAEKAKRTQESVDAKAQREVIQKGFGPIMDQIKEKTGGRYSPLVKQMVMGPDGETPITDLDQAKTIEDIYGIPEAAKKMSQSRVDKSLSLWFKSEIEAETNKRNSLESILKAKRDWTGDLKDGDEPVMVNGEKQSIASLHMAGLAPTYVNSKTQQEYYAYMTNAFKAMSNSRSDLFISTIHEFSEIVKESSLRNPECAKRLAEPLGKAITIGLNNTRMKTPVFNPAQDESRRQTIEEMGLMDEKGKRLKPSDEKGFMAAIQALPEARQKQIQDFYQPIEYDQLAAKFLENYKMDAKEFKGYTKIEKDDYGGYDVKIKDFDATIHGTMKSYMEHVAAITETIARQSYTDVTTQGLASSFGQVKPDANEGGKISRAGLSSAPK